MKRTISQNAALHKHCQMLSDVCNDAGIGQRAILEQIRLHNIPTTMESIKETYRVFMRALWPEKESTTELSTTEFQHLVEVANQFWGERLGIHVPFPSEEEMRREAQEKFYAE